MSKTTVALSTVVAQSPELVSTRIEGQTALLSIPNGAYYNMDPVGSRVWQLIAQPSAVATVVDQLLTEYSVARPVCEAQVLSFLQRLADASLVQVSDAPAR